MKLEELYALAKKGDASAREGFLMHYIRTFDRENWGEAFEELNSQIGIGSFDSFETAYNNLKVKLSEKASDNSEVFFGHGITDLKKVLRKENSQTNGAELLHTRKQTQGHIGKGIRSAAKLGDKDSSDKEEIL